MANTFELIASSTVGAGGAASIDFTSIPSTYTDLCVVLSARSDHSAVDGYVNIRFNSNNSNLSLKNLEGTGSAAQSNSYTGYLFTVCNGANSTSNTFGNATIYVPNYAGSNAKSLFIDAVNETNATAVFSQLVAGLWNDTSAITSISLSAVAGNLVSARNFVQYSTAYLYGVKNA